MGEAPKSALFENYSGAVNRLRVSSKRERSSENNFALTLKRAEHARSYSSDIRKLSVLYLLLFIYFFTLRSVTFY